MYYRSQAVAVMLTQGFLLINPSNIFKEVANLFLFLFCFSCFVAGAVLCGPCKAHFVASAGLCGPWSAEFVAGAGLFVGLEVQISWQMQDFVGVEV